MNKGQAKKRYTKALDSTVNPNKYKGKYSTVSLINPIVVDKKGDIMKRELCNKSLAVPQAVKLSNAGFIYVQGNRFLAVPQTVEGEK